MFMDSKSFFIHDTKDIYSMIAGMFGHFCISCSNLAVSGWCPHTKCNVGIQLDDYQALWGAASPKSIITISVRMIKLLVCGFYGIQH